MTKRNDHFTRRQWIRTSSGILVGAGLAGIGNGYASGAMYNRQQPQQIQERGDAPNRNVANPDPDEKELIFHTEVPPNGEPEMNSLTGSWITPTKHFYVRSHAPAPQIDRDSFRLTVDGMVRNKLELSFADLASMQRHSTTATMTCAGNRRAEFNAEKEVGGVPWGAGAIGNATWSGFSLADVLQKAEVTEGAAHIWMEGLDQIEKKGDVIPFGGSIPIERAIDRSGTSTVLLADTMNEQPLTADHGFPLRTVVPGYIGARSVKWLGKITVSDRPSPNHYLATAYKLVNGTSPIDWAESGPIYRYPVNLAICEYAIAADLQMQLAGYALPSGRPGAKIERVLVRYEGEQRWKQARLLDEPKEFCWTRWAAELDSPNGNRRIVARAEDSTGAFMPEVAPWNAKGYLQNSWFKLDV